MGQGITATGLALFWRERDGAWVSKSGYFIVQVDILPPFQIISHFKNFEKSNYLKV